MTPPDDKLRDWRKKDRARFEDGDLVDVFEETGLREVWLYHERICDRIDTAGRNETTTNLYTLAREVHDDPPGRRSADFDTWLASRVLILDGLRDRGRVMFEGDVTLRDELTFSLPARTYAKWHTRSGHHVDQERQPGGQFGPKRSGNGAATVGSRSVTDAASEAAPKTPASTDDHRNGAAPVRTGPTTDRPSREREREEGEGEEATTTNGSRTRQAAIGQLVSGGSSGSGEDRYEAEHAARRDVQRPTTPLSEVGAAQERIRLLLSEIFVDANDANTMAVTIASTKRRQPIGRPPKVYDISVWERAVRVLVRQVLEDGRTIDRDPMGLIVAMVPSYEAEGSDRKMLVRAVGVQTETPAADPDEIRRRFDREAQEHEGVAS